jgi:ferredoxin
MAVPFVTYGGVNSGVALEEAAALLDRSGRRTVAGMKVDSCHWITMMDQVETKLNPGKPGREAERLCEELAGEILDCQGSGGCGSVARDLRYQRLGSRLKARLIFRERLWHRVLYPRIVFDHELCTGCGSCERACPVRCIEMTGEGPEVRSDGPSCIHCCACVLACPSDAVRWDANWDRWNRLIAKAARGEGILPSNESPRSAVYAASTR